MELPDGWTSEEIAGNTVLGMPNFGSVTICWATRGFALGFTQFVRPMSGYTGRGWKDRLYADGVKALQEVWRDELARAAFSD